MSHDLIVLHKIGEETGIRLQAAACTCGWRAACWYATDQNMRDSYARHINALALPDAPAWMLAPEAAK
jgi:hypothetical protein